ncbi:MAG: hypothetical protein CVV30_10185 [Methanomicrobiales archaeon HGW-Methanomicrobiales-1]|jgi:hypothetical protein|nr:MAG: hypothetical protein CVV30_10185 [Methanomicrobiales archaeon HGW-Methanomicrobiales-1]
MKKNIGWMAGIFMLALLCIAGAAAAQEDTGTITDGAVIVDDVAPYDGPIGPGSPLYGLKIAFEDLDVSFTANETERFNLQMNTNRLRLSEARRELQLNNTDAADRALNIYGQKTNMTRLQLQTNAGSNVTGLLFAQGMNMKNQLVLANLIDTHPGNKGLMRAYNNSLSLEQKFQEKTQTRFERVMQKNNATIVRAVRLETSEQQNTRNAGQNQTLQVQKTQQVQQGTGNGMDNSMGQNRVTVKPSSQGQQKVQTTVTITPARTTDDKGSGNSGTGNNGNSDGNSGRNPTIHPAPETGKNGRT